MKSALLGACALAMMTGIGAGDGAGGVEDAANAGRKGGPAGRLDQRQPDDAGAAAAIPLAGHSAGAGRADGEAAGADDDRVQRADQPQRRRADRPQRQCRLQHVLDRSGHALWRGEGRDARLVDRRPRGRAHPLHAGSEEASRRPARQGARHMGRPGDPAAGRALHRRLRLDGGPADGERPLQQQLPVRADADARGDHCGDDPRLPASSRSPTSARRRASTSGWAIRSAGGRATRWWSRRAASIPTSACGRTWATVTMSARTRR